MPGLPVVLVRMRHGGGRLDSRFGVKRLFDTMSACRPGLDLRSLRSDQEEQEPADQGDEDDDAAP